MASTSSARNSIVPAQLLGSIRSILTRLKGNSNTPLLPFIPRPFKVLLLLLVILNSPSFPFQWHIRVWWHAIKAYWFVYRKGRSKYLRDWEKQNLARGQVRGLRTRMERIAWVDDCDYNLHLSNSCYAKNSDPARMDYCIQSMSPLFTPGVAMALAGSHYQFLKEIPIGSPYVMETRIAGWGDKWLYVVTEFIIYPKSKPTSSISSTKSRVDKQIEAVKSAGETFIPSISAPGTGDNTPEMTSGTASPIPNMEEAKKVAARARAPRSDGGVVTCVAVFEYCFKLGRVTVPPRIALHAAFQSPTKEGRQQAYDRIFTKDQGKAWLRGGWKDEPDADQIGRDIGVDAALGGEAEPWSDKARKGMEEVSRGLSTVA